MMSWASRSEQLEPDAAVDGKSRAEPTDRQTPCLLLQPASSHLNLSPLRPTLHPGRNVSRSCTEAGWTPLEPGPYPVACGLDDNSSSLDEVGLHAPHTHTHTHTHTQLHGPAGSFHSVPPRGMVALCVGARTPGICPPQASSLSRPTFPGAHPPAPLKGPGEGFQESASRRMTHSSKAEASP